MVITTIFVVVAFTSRIVLAVMGLGAVLSLMGVFNFAHDEPILLGVCTAHLMDKAGFSEWAGKLSCACTTMPRFWSVCSCVKNTAIHGNPGRS